MKKYLLSGLLILALFSVQSCRKKILRDVQTLEDIGAVHCTNFKQDADELGVDCGGECEPCAQQTPPCTLNDDEIDIYTVFNVQTLSVDGEKTLTVDSLSGTYTFLAYTGTGTTEYLEIIFNSKPDITKTYKDHELLATTGSVSVIYHSNSALDRYAHGELFVNHENGKYTLSSCDADFYNPWSGSSIQATQSFKVTFD